MHFKHIIFVLFGSAFFSCAKDEPLVKAVKKGYTIEDEAKADRSFSVQRYAPENDSFKFTAYNTTVKYYGSTKQTYFFLVDEKGDEDYHLVINSDGDLDDYQNHLLWSNINVIGNKVHVQLNRWTEYGYKETVMESETQGSGDIFRYQKLNDEYDLLIIDCSAAEEDHDYYGKFTGRFKIKR